MAKSKTLDLASERFIEEMKDLYEEIGDNVPRSTTHYIFTRGWVASKNHFTGRGQKSSIPKPSQPKRPRKS